MKAHKAVISFGILLLFGVGVFAFSHGMQGSVTAGAVREGDLPDQGPEQVTFLLDSYQISDHMLQVRYTLTEHESQAHVLQVAYHIIDRNGVLLGQGDDEIVLGAGQKIKYSFLTALSEVPRDTVSLTLTFNEGTWSLPTVMPLVFTSLPLTGSAIGARTSQLFIPFFAFLTLLVLLFYCVRAVYAVHVRRALRTMYTDRYLSV